MPPRSRLGFREGTQNYAKRNRSQISFLTCFVYRIASVIISLHQRFLQIVENIIIQLISDNKEHLDGLLFSQFPKSCSLEAYTCVNIIF